MISNTPLVAYYNGIDFSANSAVETIAANVKPVYDASGRTVKYVLYSITLRAIVYDDAQVATPDSTMESLRVRLTTPGGEFHYESRGLGRIIVNVPGVPTVGTASAARDVVWGPKPQLLTWKPHGQMACEITWSVDVAIPECPDQTAYQFWPLEFVYRLAYAIDRSGYTTRTYSGHVMIPQTRTTVSTRTISDQADRLRESINPPLLSGFRRASQTFTLSEDKCKLSFEVTDEEQPPNQLPPGVIDAQINHTVQTGTPYGAAWVGTITASYELARDTPRASAWGHFWKLVEDRRAQAARGFFVASNGEVKRGFTFLMSFSASEPEIHGRRGAAFSVTYRLMMTLRDILLTSGLWRPVPGSDWNRWSTSLANTAHHVRGAAKLRAGTDVIIDLCQPGTTRLATAGPPPGPPPRKEPGPPIGQKPPPPESSWLLYRSRIRIDPVDQNIGMKVLPRSPIKPTNQYGLSTIPFPDPPLAGASGDDGTKPLRAGGLPLNRIGQLSVYPSIKDDDVVQCRGKPSVYITLEGGAARASYPITPPSLVQVGDKQTIPANREGIEGYEQWVEDSVHGIPIHAARWRFRYLLPGVPMGTLPLMDTPWAGQ